MSQTNSSADLSVPKMKLDRLRAFGSIHPPEQLLCSNGKSIPASYAEDRPSVFAAFERDAGADIEYKTRCYEQDGFSFDAAGELIPETLDLKARARAREIEARKVAALAARRAHDDAMRAQGFAEGSFVGLDAQVADSHALSAADVANNPNDGPVSPNEKFDVVGWAQGRVQAPWFAVAKAIREQHGASLQTKAQAIEWLIDNRIVPASTVAV